VPFSAGARRPNCLAATTRDRIAANIAKLPELLRKKSDQK
jgi:hypothetical protein